MSNLVVHYYWKKKTLLLFPDSSGTTRYQEEGGHLLLAIETIVKVISGVLVRLTACKRLTNSLPKLSLITLLPPPETAGQQVGRIYGRTCQLSKPFRFLGITGESIFQVRHGNNNGESLKKFIMVDVGFEPTTRKTHGLSTAPFVKDISGVLVRLTTCKRLTNSLPKLSLTTVSRIYMW